MGATRLWRQVTSDSRLQDGFMFNSAMSQNIAPQLPLLGNHKK
jgi:hypothetical protein